MNSLHESIDQTRLGVPGGGGHAMGVSAIPPSSDARVYLELIRRHALALLATALLALALAGFWLLGADRLFESTALLRIEDEKGFMDKLLEKEREAFSSVPLAKEEAKVLSSRAVLGSAVDAMGMSIEATPQFLPGVGKSLSHYPWLVQWIREWFPDNGYAWGGESVTVSFLELPRELYGEPLNLIITGPGRYRLEYRGRMLVADGRVGEFSSVDVSPAAEGSGYSILVDEIAALPGTRFRVIRHSRESHIDALRHALTIDARESGTRVLELALKGRDPQQVAQTLNEIIDAYRRLRLSWSSGEARQELAFLEARLPAARAKLKEAEDALADYRESHRSLDVTAESRQVIKRSATIEARLRELKMRRDLLAKQYTPRYPEIEKLDAEIATTSALLAQTRRKMRAMPAVGKELMQLQREVELHSKLYDSLEQRYEKLRVAEASSLGNVQIIDRAVIPDKPVWPRPVVLIPLAVLGALFLHLVWLFIRAAFSNRVQDAETVEQVAGVPVFVDVPFSERQKRHPFVPRSLLPGSSEQSKVLAIDHPDDFTVETLRGLRAMLDSVLSRNGMLMVCGPLPRMGKSFISSNLAVLLAETGERVLLVDADFLRGGLHRNFDVPNKGGLTLLARNHGRPEEAIVGTAISGLDIVPRGEGDPPNDQDLEHALRQLAGLLGECYDHIIVDTPPVLSLSASAIIGRIAGASIMVVRSDEVTADEIRAAVKRLRLAGVDIDGCLLNNASAAGSRQRSYRYGYAG